MPGTWRQCHARDEVIQCNFKVAALISTSSINVPVMWALRGLVRYTTLRYAVQRARGSGPFLNSEEHRRLARAAKR